MGITWNMSHMIYGNMQAGIFICLDRIIGYSFFSKGKWFTADNYSHTRSIQTFCGRTTARRFPLVEDALPRL